MRSRDYGIAYRSQYATEKLSHILRIFYYQDFRARSWFAFFVKSRHNFKTDIRGVQVKGVNDNLNLIALQTIADTEAQKADRCQVSDVGD